jgi:hypothetical protein
MINWIRTNVLLILFTIGATVVDLGVATIFYATLARWVSPAAGWGAFAATVGFGLAVGALELPRIAVIEEQS